MNFEIIKHIVEYAEMNKGSHEIRYNVVTNLTLISDEIIDFSVAVAHALVEKLKEN